MVSCAESSAGATICSVVPSSCGFNHIWAQEVPSSCNMKNKLQKVGVEVGRWLGGYWSIQVITWLRVSSGDGEKWRELTYLGGTSHRRGEDEGQESVKDNFWVSELDDWRASGCMALFTFNLSLSEELYFTVPRDPIPVVQWPGCPEHHAQCHTSAVVIRRRGQ